MIQHILHLLSLYSRPDLPCPLKLYKSREGKRTCYSSSSKRHFQTPHRNTGAKSNFRYPDIHGTTTEQICTDRKGWPGGETEKEAIGEFGFWPSSAAARPVMVMLPADSSSSPTPLRIFFSILIFLFF
jgi:hypothetical protein